jgi:hypothetical protein
MFPVSLDCPSFIVPSLFSNVYAIRMQGITILRQKILYFPIAEEGAKILGVYRVKNHDFMPKNLFFSHFRGGPHPPGSAPECYLFSGACSIQLDRES